jgi:hypothetical protein
MRKVVACREPISEALAVVAIHYLPHGEPRRTTHHIFASSR